MKKCHRSLFNAVIAVVLITVAITASLIFLVWGFWLSESGDKLFGLPVQILPAIAILLYVAFIFYKMQLRTLSTGIVACVILAMAGYLVYYAIIRAIGLFICSLYQAVYSSVPFM